MIRDKATRRKRGSKMIFRKPTLGKYPLACLLYDESVHQDGCDGGQYKRYYDALNNGTLEIQGYVREELFHETVKKAGEWTRFNPNDPKTFPIGYENVLLYVERDDGSRQMMIARTFIMDKCHFLDLKGKFISEEKMDAITHWRPLPEPPVESNCE